MRVTSLVSGADDVSRLTAAPRVRLGRWPTPLDRHTLTDGTPVLVKQDVASGWGRGGAKTRKIEHLVGHLLKRGHDELITVAGNVTNLAFDLLPALDRHGITPSLLIQDDPPLEPADREAVFEGIRDRVVLMGRSRLRTLAAAAGAYARSLAAGRRPFLLLPGGSHPSGVVGNACGFVEMVGQLRREGRPTPRVVFVTAATGTTVAGFLIADAALRRAGHAPIRVIGVQAYPGLIGERTLALVRWTERSLGLAGVVPRRRIRIDASLLHGGFGAFPEELAAECRRLDDEGGPRIDPIFGGKTWNAMQRWAAGRRRSERPILYWHCGYTPEWEALGRWVHQGGLASSAAPQRKARIRRQ